MTITITQADFFVWLLGFVCGISVMAATVIISKATEK